MDKFGSCQEIALSRLSQCSELDLSSFTQADFRHMCILSGCDYVANVPGIGMKKAHALVAKHRDPAKVQWRLRLLFLLTFARFSRPSGWIHHSISLQTTQNTSVVPISRFSIRSISYA